MTVGKCAYVNGGRTSREGLERSVGQGARVCIYHLLSAAFSQGVAITQVIDLDVLDVVTVLLVDLDIEGSTIASRGRLGTAWSDTGGVGLDGKSQHLPRKLPSYQDRRGQGHTARIGGTSTCCGAFFWLSWALIRAAASAAAAAASLLGPDPSTVFATGLRLRVARSLSPCGGERERRSNLLRRGGSSWSKRERLRGSSPMLDGCSRWWVCEERKIVGMLGWWTRCERAVPRSSMELSRSAFLPREQLS